MFKSSLLKKKIEEEQQYYGSCVCQLQVQTGGKQSVLLYEVAGLHCTSDLRVNSQREVVAHTRPVPWTPCRVPTRATAVPTVLHCPPTSSSIKCPHPLCARRRHPWLQDTSGQQHNVKAKNLNENEKVFYMRNLSSCDSEPCLGLHAVPSDDGAP